MGTNAIQGAKRRDKLWRTRTPNPAALRSPDLVDPATQLQLAIVEHLSRYNNDRLHENLGDLSPAEFETFAATRHVPVPSPTE